MGLGQNTPVDFKKREMVVRMKDEERMSFGKIVRVLRDKGIIISRQRVFQLYHKTKKSESANSSHQGSTGEFAASVVAGSRTGNGSRMDPPHTASTVRKLHS